MYEQLKAYNYLYSKEERKQLTAEALKAFRIQKKLQQKDVAELLNIKTQTYITYESGRSEPPLEILVRLSFLYEVPIDILVQKTSFKENANVTNKFIEIYENQIKELMTQIESSDPLTKAKTEPIIELIQKQIDELKKKVE